MFNIYAAVRQEQQAHDCWARFVWCVLAKRTSPVTKQPPVELLLIAVYLPACRLPLSPCMWLLSVSR
jgi:hypothetical protein